MVNKNLSGKNPVRGYDTHGQDFNADDFPSSGTYAIICTQFMASIEILHHILYLVILTFVL